MKNRLPLLLIAGLLVLFTVLAVTQRSQVYYPVGEIELPDPSGDLTLGFLFESRATLERCEAVSGSISRVVLGRCPTCRVKQLHCLNTISPRQQIQLSEKPVSLPSGRMASGVIMFQSANLDSALAACRAVEQQSAREKSPIKCFPANTPRPKGAAGKDSSIGLTALLITIAALAGAWLTAWLILKYEHLHAHLSHDHVDSGPQKYHEEPTPRIGGLTVMVGLLIAGGVMLLMDAPLATGEFGLLLLASTPAFFGGLVEDITKRVGVLERLLLTTLAGSVAAWLLGAVLNRLNIPGIDTALAWLPFAVVFTAFAVGGIANAINIIDGYNGLAGGFAVIVLMAMAYVGHQVGDHLILVTALSLAGALLGFLAWNWPGGKIFLGDGGAYLLGFILAELSVLLVARNPEVSPWFPLALLIYPVFETFYSIYRRKVRNGLSPGLPDNQHFHQLIHDNLVPRETYMSEPLSRLESNSRVAIYLWPLAAVMAVLGGMFWPSTPALIACVVGFCVFYVVNYQRIARSPAAKLGRV